MKSTNYYEFTVSLVHKAGVRLKAARTKMFEVSHKGSDERDLVTSVDLEINDFLIAEIKRAYPEHRISSEEGGDVVGQDVIEYEWKLDPIDGSANFSRNIPHFNVCAALLYKNVPIVGAVYNPITEEMFSFEQAQGAFLNGMPIRVSTITEPKDAQGLISFGHDPLLLDWSVATFRDCVKSLKKFKSLGSSALDLSFLAAGRVDVVIYGTLRLSDCAAGIGIIRAAGGEVYTPGGVPVEISSNTQTIIATSNRELFDKIQPLLHQELLPR